MDFAGGSPVKLSYNFDADPFEPAQLRFRSRLAGCRSSFPHRSLLSPGFHTLQVTAIDEAGNYLPAPESKQFRFLTVQSAIDVITQTNKSQIGSPAIITITGYTFSASDSVKSL